MGLYSLYSTNVGIEYKNSILSKAMLFTLITTILNVMLPFILAHRSRGFWLRSHNFYEQPYVHYTYEYLLVAETEDPSQPIVCGEAASLDSEGFNSDENCAEIQVQEYDYNEDGKNDLLEFEYKINIPKDRTIASLLLILTLDFKLTTVCPLHMQSLAVINRAFAVPPSGFKYYGDLQFYQTAQLPCLRNHIDTKYNSSLFEYTKDSTENVVDFILEHYFSREITTEIKTIHSRSQNGHTGTMHLKARLRVPEMQVLYIPSLLQELKWAWPQYLSLVVVFYWIFNKIKSFIFNNRLLMAWKVIPWKQN